MRTYQEIVYSVYGQDRNSFWSGFAGLFDFFGKSKLSAARRPVSRSTDEALTEDWARVSQDLERAFHRAGCR